MSLKHIRLGILVPSSNTALEPLTSDLVTTINTHLSSQSPPLKISAHYSRFPVTQISLDPKGLAQFELPPILAAATLLAHANVDIIGWSGTSAGWLGFDRDDELCAEIEKTTGVKATSSVVGLNKALKLWGVERLGLVTPYIDDVQAKIVDNYKGIGVEIGKSERHLKVTKNCDIAEIEEDVLGGCIGDVTKDGKVQAVTTFCTNLIAAHKVEDWEEIYGVPVFDTVTTVVVDMLKMCGVDVAGVKGWGMMFQK